MLVDSHCHLDFDWFDKDRHEVIERAGQAGVLIILNPGINLLSSQAAVELAAQRAAVGGLRIYAAVGVHPNDAQSWNESSLADLRKMAGMKETVAIGEIGLDYYRDLAPQALQREIFQQQLTLAGETGLPVVVHCRNESQERSEAMADILRITGDWAAGLAKNRSPLAGRLGVLHSFSGGLQAAQQAVELGFYIGISGPVTFQNAAEMHAIAAALPLERILVETDAPFLTPHPQRGKRNEPAFVRFTAAKIAQLRGVTIEEIEQATTTNAERLFLW